MYSKLIRELQYKRHFYLHTSRLKAVFHNGHFVHAGVAAFEILDASAFNICSTLVLGTYMYFCHMCIKKFPETIKKRFM